jgi:hypothetical protein
MIADLIRKHCLSKIDNRNIMETPDNKSNLVIEINEIADNKLLK